MSAPTRQAPIANNASGTSVTATFSEGTALAAGSYLIALGKRSVSGFNPAPDAPGVGQTDSGWTLIASISRQSAGVGNYSGFNVWVGVYVRNSNGTVNSFKFGSSTAAWTTLALFAAPNYKSPGYYATDLPAGTVGNAASATIDGPDPSAVDSLIMGIMGLTGSAGGSGITNSSGWTNVGGQSSSSGTYFGYLSTASAGERDLALAWTTSGHYAGITIAFDTSTPATPIVASGAITGGAVEVTLTADSGGPITSVTAAIVSGPAGYTTANVSITGAVATCDDPPGRTEAIVIDFTVNNAGSSDVVRMTLPVPGGAPVTVLEEIYTASGWVGV